MVTRADFDLLASANDVELCEGLDAIVVGGSSLLRLIDLAEAQGLVVLGLDGLKLDGGNVIPLMDYLADFGAIDGSRESRVTSSAAAARMVAQGWGPMPDLVEVTLDGVDA